MNLIFLILFVPCLAVAKSKMMFGSVYDSLGVEHMRLDSGKNVLVVSKKDDAGKFKETATIDLALKNTEFVSEGYSFRCWAVGPTYAYQQHYAIAVIDKSDVSKDEPVHPRRAWMVDKKAAKLVPVKDPKTIECSWHQEGDGKYPFPEK